MRSAARKTSLTAVGLFLTCAVEVGALVGLQFVIYGAGALILVTARGLSLLPLLRWVEHETPAAASPERGPERTNARCRTDSAEMAADLDRLVRA
jgi:hypothetical protein